MRVETVVARGGVGTVYRTVDVDTGAPLALKVYHPTKTGAWKSRDLKSVESTATLIVPRQVDDFLPYAIDVTPFIEGEQLRVGLGRGLLTVHDAIALAHDISEALAALHRKGLTHNDVKPENILRTSNRYLLIDVHGFELEPYGGTDANGPAVMFTPRYAAPEVRHGMGANPSSDVYSLGLVLAEASAGTVDIAAAVEAYSSRAEYGPLLTLVKQMTHADPESRISPEAISVQAKTLLDQGQPAMRLPRILEGSGDLARRYKTVDALLEPSYGGRDRTRGQQALKWRQRRYWLSELLGVGTGLVGAAVPLTVLQGGKFDRWTLLSALLILAVLMATAAVVGAIVWARRRFGRPSLVKRALTAEVALASAFSQALEASRFNPNSARRIQYGGQVQSVLVSRVGGAPILLETMSIPGLDVDTFEDWL